MTHICRFLLTESRLTGRVSYVCHVCGAVRPEYVPIVEDKPKEPPCKSN